VHHIGLDRTLDGTRIILLICGYDVRVIHATTGEIIRTVTINPQRRYHGTGRPQADQKDPESQQNLTLMQDRSVLEVPQHHLVAGARTVR
jgi:hypothetical protein